MIIVWNIDGRWAQYDNGESTMTDENGWIYVIDADGLTLAAHPKERVERVSIEPKAGETTVTSDNSKDGN